MRDIANESGERTGRSNRKVKTRHANVDVEVDQGRLVEHFCIVF